MASRDGAPKRSRSSIVNTRKSKPEKNRNQVSVHNVESTDSAEEPFIDLTEEVETVDLTSHNESPVVYLGQRIASFIEHRTNLSAVRPGPHASAETELIEIGRSESPDLPVVDFGSSLSSEKGVNDSSRIEVNCPVCFDNVKQIQQTGRELMSTVCGHVFCCDCIRNSIRNSRQCPSCRKKLTLRQIHPIFLH